MSGELPDFQHREILSIADAMPDVLSSLARMQEKAAEFFAEVRPQFEAAPETKACEHHPLAIRPKVFDETCQRTRMEGRFVVAYAPCPECADARTKERHRAFWTRRGVPGRVIDSTLSNFEADTAERRKAMAEVLAWNKRNGNFLVLRGTTGTGKGHMAAACLKAQGDGLFITHADMLADLRASYTLKNTRELLESWQAAAMFVLDEFGLSPGGNDEEPMLYQVLAKRYEDHRPTIITTNLDRDTFRQKIGFRLIDRIGEDCTIVVCEWDSYRRPKQ